MYNIFDTHAWIGAVENIPKLSTFLRDRYFPTNTATDVFGTEDVLVEYKDGSRKLAPFVVPRKGGVAVLRKGYTAERYTPPYIAPKRIMSVDDLKRKGFGESIYSQATAADRQALLILRDFDELGQMIDRREEAMAAETLLTNGCVMKHIVDNASKPEIKELRFYEGGTNPAVFTPSTDWDDAGAHILDDIFAVAEEMAKDGLPATDLIVSPDVGSAIMHNEEILKLLDNRNVNIGGIDPTKLPAGVTKLARLNCNGHVVDILQYTAIYTDDDDKSKQYIPAGKAVLTAPGCGRTLYGAVTQLEQTDGQFHTYTARRVPKQFSDIGSNVRELYLTSCPLIIPNNKNAWRVINAINP